MLVQHLPSPKSTTHFYCTVCNDHWPDVRLYFFHFASKISHRKSEKEEKKATEREAEVLPTRPQFFPLLDSLCSASWFFSLPQPNVGNVNQQKAAIDLQGGIWIHLFESSRTPTSPAGRSYFRTFRGLEGSGTVYVTQKQGVVPDEKVCRCCCGGKVFINVGC